MHQGHNSAFSALRRRLTGTAELSAAASTGRGHARGTYRSSRDTAAASLRGEDARLAGVAPQDRRPAADALVNRYPLSL